MDPQQDAAPDPLVGKVLGGRFTVRHLIGEGGMGAVYLGEQKLGGTTRKVAIKTLHAHLSHDPKILARFERECGTVAELQHPNTIQVFDYGKTDDGILYIVMEYVEGKSVAEVLEKEGPMPPARVENILKQVAGSLQEAHDHGIVHRDLKPDNIVLCERAGQKDWVEVLDFGIAKRSNEEDKNEQKLTQQGMVLGTPPYMSPEQFTGEPIDKRSDIYSLGVMAYEMLTGRLPFSGNTAWEWATQHMTAQPQPLEATPIGARIPENMRHAIERALHKRREERFESVKEFVDAFASAGAAASVAAGVGVQGHPGGTAPLAAGVGGGGAPRVKTEVGAAPDAAAMAYGAAPVGYGASLPSPAPPVAGYGAPPPPQGMTPASGHQAFVAPQPVYGQQDAEPSGGGKRGLIVGVLVFALLAFGGVALVGAGVFKKKEPADNIFGSSTAPPATTIAVPTSTDTGGTANTGTTPTVEQTTKPTNTGKPPTTHPSSKPTATTTGTTTATATTPPTAPATTPPTKTTTPPPPPPPPQPNPPECALAQKFCSNPASHTPGSPMQAACTSNKSACLQKGGHL